MEMVQMLRVVMMAFSPERLQVQGQFKSELKTQLSQPSPDAQEMTGVLAQCHDNVTEWDISSCCRQYRFFIE